MERELPRSIVGKLAQVPGIIWLLYAVLSAIGFAMLYSASGGHMEPWLDKQLIRFVPGLLITFVIACLPLEWLLKLAPLAYWCSVGLLVVVELYGTEGKGAQRWLDLGGGVTIQPSELMKMALIVMLARYFQRVNYEQTGSMLQLIPALVLIAIPVVLILKQPNLGTATITTFIGVTMIFVAGLRWWKLSVVVVGVAAALPIIWNVGLHDYQKQRVLTFLDPQSDPLGSGYNILQSMIAIGAGGMQGMGYLKGSQGQLDFLPEKHTDFIFTMLSEEFGFLGGAGFLGLYTLLLICIYYAALTSQNQPVRLIAVGVASFFFVHLFINTAMVMGMIPVVGVPLPFLSYGGTILLSTQMAMGLVFHCFIYRKKRVLK